MPSPDSQNNQPVEKLTGLMPLVIIIGPTAVGKTEISLKLAERFNGEIVSADSRLFYRGMDIGTAKPCLEERKRIPHHLVDVADPDEVWSLALFQREAHKAIQGILHRHHLPFLVGGTGQFIRALTEGWSPPAVHPNPLLRQILAHWAEELGPVDLHHKLAILDPQSASSIDPLNVRRTVRAMEVILTSGMRFSDQKQTGYLHYNPLTLGLITPRPDLYRRIDERIEAMIRDGLIEEVQRLLAQGYSPDLPTMSAIGYGEVVDYIQGKIRLDEAIRLMKRRTRKFVRRQANWFKADDPHIHWFQAGSPALDEMSEVIRRWLVIIGGKFNTYSAN